MLCCAVETINPQLSVSDLSGYTKDELSFRGIAGVRMRSECLLSSGKWTFPPPVTLPCQPVDSEEKAVLAQTDRLSGLVPIADDDHSGHLHLVS